MFNGRKVRFMLCVIIIASFLVLAPPYVILWHLLPAHSETSLGTVEMTVAVVDAAGVETLNRPLILGPFPWHFLVVTFDDLRRNTHHSNLISLGAICRDLRS